MVWLSGLRGNKTPDPRVRVGHPHIAVPLAGAVRARWSARRPDASSGNRAAVLAARPAGALPPDPLDPATMVSRGCRSGHARYARCSGQGPPFATASRIRRSKRLLHAQDAGVVRRGACGQARSRKTTNGYVRRSWNAEANMQVPPALATARAPRRGPTSRPRGSAAPGSRTGPRDRPCGVAAERLSPEPTPPPTAWETADTVSSRCYLVTETGHGPSSLCRRGRQKMGSPPPSPITKGRA